MYKFWINNSPLIEEGLEQVHVPGSSPYIICVRVMLTLYSTAATNSTAGPFLIDTPAGKLMAISGLALLMLQAYDKKCYNLIILNLIGIIGYASNFFI